MMPGDHPRPNLIFYAAYGVPRALFESAVYLFCTYDRLQSHTLVGHVTNNQRHEENGTGVCPYILGHGSGLVRLGALCAFDRRS